MGTRIGERGQAMPLLGLALMVLMGMGAVSVDVGYLQYQQTRMQSATDAAALAGARALIGGGCPDKTDATTAAENDSTLDNFTAGSNVTVTVDNPPASTDGPYSGNDCAVAVTITVPHNADWFLKLFGYSKGMGISTEAVALEQPKSSNCIVAENPSATISFANATVSAPNCGILINGSPNFSGATVNAQLIGYAGNAPTSGSFTGASPAKMLPTQDVCTEIAGCAGVTAHPPSATGCKSVSTMGGSFDPGCYSSLDLSGCMGSGGTVTLNPGTYVLTGSSDFSGATLEGSGVTFYVASGATAPNFNAAAGGSLSAPASGTYANVLYYQVPGNGSNPTFGGNLSRLSGLIYAPGANDVSYGGIYGDVVLASGGATFRSGSGSAVTIPNASGFVEDVVLVQ